MRPLIGATTRYALISQPLRDRFGSTYRLDFYDEEALTRIVRRSAEVLKVAVAPVTPDAAPVIADTSGSLISRISASRESRNHCGVCRNPATIAGVWWWI